MKTKKHKLVTLIFMLACALSFFAACITTPNPPLSSDPPTETLAAPTDLRLENGSLRWQGVPGAQSYNAKIGTIEIPGIEAFQVNMIDVITASGTYAISVRGVDEDGESGAEAAMSATAVKLATPAVETDSDEDGWFFVWADDPNAVRYSYSRDGGQSWEYTTQTSLQPGMAGTYTIRLKSIGNISASDGETFYIDSDPSAESDPITVSNDRPWFSFDNITGTFSIGTIDGADKYVLEIDGGESNAANGGFEHDVTTGVTNLYPSHFVSGGAGILTATGIYDMRIVAYDGITRLSGGTNVTVDTNFIGLNEVYSFDNEWPINNNTKNNVLTSYSNAIKMGDRGYSIKLDVGEQRGYGQLDINLTGRTALSHLGPSSWLSYWIYVVKPAVYEGDTVPYAAAPYLANTNNSHETYSMTVDGQSLGFGTWTRMYLPISPAYDYGSVLSLRFVCDQVLWGLRTNEEGWGLAIEGGYTFYMDDIYVATEILNTDTLDYDYVYEGSQAAGLEDLRTLKLDTDLGYDVTGLSAGDAVDITFTWTAGTIFGNDIAVTSNWVYVIFYGDLVDGSNWSGTTTQTGYVLLNFHTNTPDHETDYAFKARFTLGEDCSIKVRFDAFNRMGDYFAFKVSDVEFNTIDLSGYDYAYEGSQALETQDMRTIKLGMDLGYDISDLSADDIVDITFQWNVGTITGNKIAPTENWVAIAFMGNLVSNDNGWAAGTSSGSNYVMLQFHNAQPDFDGNYKVTVRFVLGADCSIQIKFTSFAGSMDFFAFNIEAVVSAPPAEFDPNNEGFNQLAVGKNTLDSLGYDAGSLSSGQVVDIVFEWTVSSLTGLDIPPLQAWQVFMIEGVFQNGDSPAYNIGGTHTGFRFDSVQPVFGDIKTVKVRITLGEDCSFMTYNSDETFTEILYTKIITVTPVS